MFAVAATAHTFPAMRTIVSRPDPYGHHCRIDLPAHTSRIVGLFDDGDGALTDEVDLTEAAADLILLGCRLSWQGQAGPAQEDAVQVGAIVCADAEQAVIVYSNPDAAVEATVDWPQARALLSAACAHLISAGAQADDGPGKAEG